MYLQILKDHMNVMNDSKHQFALFMPHLSDVLSTLALGQEYNLIDADLVHRMSVILRLQITQLIILFDQKMHCTVAIEQFVKKKSILVRLLEKKNNLVLHPTITFLLPLPNGIH